MRLRLPGLEIREPLKPRPIFGALVGAGTGALFALLANTGAFAVSRNAQSIGFIGGGIVGGAAAGSLFPFFRRRLSAGLVVWLAMTLGLFVANHAWHEYPEPLGSILLGLIGGVTYASLFWDYRGESTGAMK
jgi:MFS family permease